MNMTTEQIFATIAELIALLRTGGYEKLAAILEHRMHKVSWTSSSELLEEIGSVLTKFVGGQENHMDALTLEKMKSIIKEIESALNEEK